MFFLRRLGLASFCRALQGAEIGRGKIVFAGKKTSLFAS